MSASSKSPGSFIRPRAVISGNVLLSHDKIGLVDDERGERASASYANSVAWLKWEAEWNDAIRSRTILALSDIGDEREGSVSLPGIVDGALDDERDLNAYQLRQDWTWVLSTNWMVSFGADIKHLDAEYRHNSSRTPRRRAVAPESSQRHSTRCSAMMLNVRWTSTSSLTAGSTPRTRKSGGGQRSSWCSMWAYAGTSRPIQSRKMIGPGDQRITTR